MVCAKADCTAVGEQGLDSLDRGRVVGRAILRDDHGGVMMNHGGLEAAGTGRPSLRRRLGLQAHHDDIKVADGEITRIDVRPDWGAVDTIGVTVMTLPLRPTRQTSGRALQVASDPARIVRDGVAVGVGVLVGWVGVG